MKKIKLLLFGIIFILLFPIYVYAAGNISVSTSNVTIIEGKSTTFTITATNAVGRVDISSSNTGIATVNKSSEWLENNSITVTITGVSVGTTSIQIRLSDAATFDNEDLSGITKTINVTVSPKPVLDNNFKIKDLTVPGYNVTKIDDNNYSLVVENDVSSISINALLETAKAKISGNGDYDLKVGENIITLVVTAESGLQNKIYIKITRKDVTSLNDLNSAISNNNPIIDVNINKSNHISADELNKIKKSGKTVSLNYTDENQKTIYAWKIDGSSLSNVVDFNTKLSFTSDDEKLINSSSNYAKGKILNFAHSGNLPLGVKIKVFVGDTFADNSLLNIYYYNNGKFELVKNGIKVENGYIEYGLSHCSTYFATMASLDNDNPVCNCDIPNDSGIPNLVIILGVALSALTIFNIYYFFIKKNKNNY